MPIPLHPVKSESGNHVAAGYDEATRVLRVEFKGGQKYDYCGVIPEIAKCAFEAPSFGRYLSAVIKPACPPSKVKAGE